MRTIRILRKVVVGLTLLGLTACTAEPPVKNPVYMGLFSNRLAAGKALKPMAPSFGRRPQLVAWEQNWTQPFSQTACRTYLERDQLAHIHWLPTNPTYPDEISLQTILDGEWDGYIDDWAREVKDYRYPVLVSLAPDFNAPDTLWGYHGKNWINDQPQTPEQYKATYHYIVSRFKKIGAMNVIWVWTYSGASAHFNADRDAITRAFPGPEVVDWIGFTLNLAGDRFSQDLSDRVAFNSSLADKPQMITGLTGFQSAAAAPTGISAKISEFEPFFDRVRAYYLMEEKKDPQSLEITETDVRHAWRRFFEKPNFNARIDAFNRIGIQ